MIKTLSYAILALLAFAGNSVLCRLALADQSIDPASFTIIRIASGTGALMFILVLKRTVSRSASVPANAVQGSWWGALCLFSYAALFSFAYITLDTATGALILFGAVQFSIIGINIFHGNTPTLAETLGALLALFGLAYLLWPELSQPSLYSAMLMLASGVAWGCYTLNGRSSQDALADTAFNFLRSLPLAALLFVLAWESLQFTAHGVWLAVASGAITSGVGYAIWYAVLPALRALHAGVIQLLVPALAAAGGVVFVGEDLSLRLVLASLLILGGILLTVITKPA